MKTIPLGKSPLQSSRIAYGCWRLGGPGEPNDVSPERVELSKLAVIAAYEAGYTLFDLADIYVNGHSESIVGSVLKDVSGMRERVLISSKCGIRKSNDPAPGAPYRYDFSAEYIIQSCENSLKRLGIETLDLYMLHRPDFLMDPTEVAVAFAKLNQAGKVREFGVSNFKPSQVSVLQQACSRKLAVNQVEISLSHLHSLHDGTLDQCFVEGLTPLAWSPLAGGRIPSNSPIEMNAPDRVQKQKVRDVLEGIAREHHTTRAVVALAWLLKHPARIIPIIGSTNPEHIKAATQADDLALTREEWYRLMEAAHGSRLP